MIFFKKIKEKRLERARRLYFRQCHLDIYFGVPGAGKTTYAACLARRALKLGIPVFSNVPIKGCYQLEPKVDLGKYLVERCLVIIDEAGLEHNNREFSKFSKDNRYFYKFHRHYSAKVAVFSQADDMDLTLRNVAYRLYLIKKSIIPFLVRIRPMVKYIDIDDRTHQPMAMYQWDWFINNRWIFSPMYWSMFDTYDAKPLIPKAWNFWYNKK